MLSQVAITCTPLAKEQTELLPDQEKLVDALCMAAIAQCASYVPTDLAKVKPWLELVYKSYSLLVPEQIEVYRSPHAALKRAAELTGASQTATDSVGVADANWVTWAEAYHRMGVVSAEEMADTWTVRSAMEVLWDTILLDEAALIIERPLVLCHNARYELHSSTGPALEWADGNRDYRWNGVVVPEKLIMAPHSYTRDEYTAITNTEVRRALCEHAGWEWVAELLGARITSVWTDPLTSLCYELLKCSNGQQMLRKQSPPLADGSQPVYVEPVHEDLLTAQAARKWQATTETAENCNHDPSLTYTLAER